MQETNFETKITPTKASVLVVDDDPDFLSLVATQLQQIPGVEVSVARGPSEAIRLLTKNNYDLVVSDWALDSHTAPEVLTHADRLLDKTEPAEETKVPVMFMSGSEKVSQTQRLNSLKHFEPVSFLLKRCGPPFISLLAEMILIRFWTRREMQPC